MIVNLDVWSDYKGLWFWRRESFKHFTLVDITFESITNGSKELHIAVLGFHITIEWCFNDG